MDWSIFKDLNFNHMVHHDEPQPFYGFNADGQFKLGDHAWQAVAFEHTGILKEVIRIDNPTGIFPDEPITHLCISGQNIHGFNKSYLLYDPVDKSIWLKICTENWFWEPRIVIEYAQGGAAQCLRNTVSDVKTKHS